jgi:hypothetical protein
MTATATDAWDGATVAIDGSACPICLREICEGDCSTSNTAASRNGLDPSFLTDGADVAREGQEIAARGIPYLVDGIVPAYGMLGFLIAFAKVGKTTFGQFLAAAVALGLDVLGRATKQARVLIIAAEDPSEYTAYTARHLTVPA